MRGVLKVVVPVLLVVILASIITEFASGHRAAETVTTTSTVGNVAAVATSIAPAGLPPITPIVVPSTCGSGDQCDLGFEASNIQLRRSFAEIGGTIQITNLNSQTDGLDFTVTFFPSSNLSASPIGSATGEAVSIGPGQTVTESIISTDAVLNKAIFYWQFQVDGVVPEGA